jgi:hypothetical protein
MATASNDGTLKLWNTKDLTALPVSFDDNDGFVMAIEFSPDGQMIVSGGFGETGNIIGRPAYAEVLARDMCKAVSRNLTTDEWSAYIGKDIRYEKTCTDKDFIFKVNEIR